MLRKLTMAAGLIAVLAAPVMAGPATDRMADCLVKNTTGQDRIDLIRWTVLAYSKHPDVASFITADPEIEQSIHARMAELFTVLLVDRCKAESKAALAADGNIAIEKAFEVLGGVAGGELFLSEDVNAAITTFAQQVDEDKIMELYK